MTAKSIQGSQPEQAIRKTKKFTILHSNDMHGDFLAEVQGKEGKLIGGLALLSGYINQIWQDEENVLYVISGDMVQGSLVDTEYKVFPPSKSWTIWLPTS